MEISEHCIRFPSPHELDDHGVDIGTEKGHGAASAKGASTNVRRGQA